MRVLHVISGFHPAVASGGPIAAVRTLTAGLAAVGVSVAVETTDWDGPRRVPPGQGTVDGVPVRYHAGLFRSHYGFCPPLFASLLAGAGKHDIIHCHGIFQLEVSFALWMAVARRMPVVVTPHGSLMEHALRGGSAAKGGFLRCHRPALRRAWFHATSAEEASSIRALGYPRVFTVPFAVDADDFHEPRQVNVRRELGLPAEGRLVVTMCRLDPVKNLEALMEASRGLGVQLVIAGDAETPYGRELRRRVARDGRTDVHFPGYVDGELKAALLQQADVYVCSSFMENFGVSVVEALASSCPVVATTGTPWRVLVDRGAGFVVSPDPAGLRAGIEAVLAVRSPEQLRTSASRLAVDFAPEACALAMKEAYDRILEEDHERK